MRKHLRLGAVCGAVMFAATWHHTATAGNWPEKLNSGPKIQPNIILITADDVGADAVSLYTDPYERPELFQGSVVPPTPTLESMAEQGMVFENAWAMPACTATRGTWITGKLPSVTGISQPLSPQNTPPDNPTHLDLDDPDLLPKRLRDAGYTTAFIGKWHLTGPDQGPAGPLSVDDTLNRDDPLEAGFDYWAGILYGGPILGYYNWLQDVNGERTVTSIRPPRFQTKFTLVENVDRAVDWINGLPSKQPYFIHLSLSAPHFPYELPPKELVAPSVIAQVEEVFRRRIPDFVYPMPTGADSTPDLENLAESRVVFNALMSAIDTEIARLIDEGGVDFNDTYVMFMGDNGTQGGGLFGVVAPPFDTDRSKGSLYRNGVEVPLVVAGPLVMRDMRSKALVNSADVYATVLELARAGIPYGVEAKSFALSLLTGHPGRRNFNVAEFHIATPEVGGRMTLAVSQAGRVVANQNYRLLAQQAVEENEVICIPDVPGEISYSPDCTAEPPVPGVPGTKNGRKVFTLELYDIKGDPMETNNLLDDPRSMHYVDIVNFRSLCTVANDVSRSSNYYFQDPVCDPYAALYR